MHRALIALLAGLLYSAVAQAAPVVVWFTPDRPEDRDVRKAEAVLEGEEFRHLSGVDLAFPPQPWSDEDDRAYEAMRAEVVEGRARWDQFDVELDIAEQLDAAISAVDVVRDRRDLEQVVGALLLEGAAVSRAFPPFSFGELDEAAPFRASVPGAKVNRPWLNATGMQWDRNFNRGDLADGGPWPQFEELMSRLRDLPPGYVDLGALPRGVTIYVDGQEIEGGLKEIELRPGSHFLHVVRDGVLSGRQMVKVEAGLTTDLLPVVDDAELGAAAKTLLSGSTVGFPEDVDHSLQALGAHYGGQLYVAMSDDGRVVILPYGGAAKKVKKRPVTVVVAGELGGGVVVSPLFDGSGGDTVTSAMASGGLGLEIGIYYGAIIGGFDLALTPGKTITHGNADETENVSTSVLPQAWGGVGAYILRPNEAHTTLLVAGTYGWYGPAHLGLGGRIVLGIPIDERGTWFRLAVGGASAAKSMWDTGSDKTPMHVLFLRFGFGARF